MKKNILIVLITVFSLYFGYCIYWDFKNPFDKIEFIKDYPGATDRYITYTPVFKESGELIGEAIGADYGKLKFYDWDNDGIHEAIIETSAFFWNANYYSTITVLKYREDSSGVPFLEIIYEDEKK